MRSSRHQVARAACERPRAAPARSRMPATSPTSWVSTQRTTSAMVRPSSAAARKSGRQQLGRGGVPELAVRRRPVGLGRLAQVGGDPAGPVPLAHTRRAATRCWPARPCSRSGRCTTPGPAGCTAPSVWRSRSLFTLAASTGPRHPRMAGTARLVVLPLWVGPTTTRDWARSAASPPSRTTPGDTPEERAGRAEARPPRPAAGAGRGRRGPARARGASAPRAGARCRARSRVRDPASSAPPSATGNDGRRRDPPRAA